MSSINYDLKKIKAIIFDVDGVLSPSIIPMNDEGDLIRLLNVKDRYAIGQALREGIHIALITGAKTRAVANYYTQLGIKHLYMDSKDKTKDLESFMDSTKLAKEEIAYIGDDIPDLQVMKLVGLPIAPADAAYEIRELAKYISHLNGGEGVARDLIEQVLRAQDKWVK